MWKIHLLALAMLTFDLQAETYNLKECVSSGSSAKIRCKFPDAITLDNTETNFPLVWEVIYTFPCQFTRSGLSFSGNRGHDPLANSPIPRLAKVQGNGPLQLIDLDPAATYKSLFIGECSINVQSISKSPTIDTLIDWKAKSVNISANIKDARDSLRLAESYSSLASALAGDFKSLSDETWDLMKQAVLAVHSANLANLPLGICEFTDAECKQLLSRENMTPEQQENLDIVLIESPSFADYHRLHSHINSLPVVIDGQMKTLEEVFSIVRSELITFFRKKLLRQRAEGTKLLDRSKPFAMSFDEELAANIKALEALITEVQP